MCFSSAYWIAFYQSHLVFRQEHHYLLEKLSALEKKVIVGGVDLLAKAEEQEKLLDESNNELEERRKRAEQLRRELEEKEVGIFTLLHLITTDTLWCTMLVKFSSCQDFCSGLFCTTWYMCVPVVSRNSKSAWTLRKNTPVCRRRLKGRQRNWRKSGPCWWQQSQRYAKMLIALH